MKPEIIAIINQKGGVGKSTTAVNLSAALGEMGKHVLVIDFDPQGNATSGLGVDKRELESTVYEVLMNESPIEEAIIKNVYENLDLLPTTIDLAGAEVQLIPLTARELRFKKAIEPIVNNYDYIFIDCPPSLGLLTINALVASTKLLIPVQCEFYAMEGVTKLLESMEIVKQWHNPSLEILGVLMTMFDSQTRLSNQVVEEIEKYFGDSMFKTLIPRTVKLSEAPSYGQPITVYDRSGKGAKAYIELAKEVISRG